jgi:hypothetical protein
VLCFDVALQDIVPGSLEHLFDQIQPLFVSRLLYSGELPPRKAVVKLTEAFGRNSGLSLGPSLKIVEKEYNSKTQDSIFSHPDLVAVSGVTMKACFT